MFDIVDKHPYAKGEIYTIKFRGKTARILFLKHAIERIKRWNITIDMVLETLLLPDEVLIGHRNRYIAHKRYAEHLVRAVYEYDGDLPVLVTVYFPYADRYFRGGKIHEDKILK